MVDQNAKKFAIHVASQLLKPLDEATQKQIISGLSTQVPNLRVDQANITSGAWLPRVVDKFAETFDDSAGYQQQRATG